MKAISWSLVSLCSGWRKHPFSNIMAQLAFGLGILLLLISYLFASQARSFFATTLGGSDKSEFLVINKEISILNNLDPDASSFKPKEIEGILSLPFVREYFPVSSNLFKTYAEIHIGTLIYGTELYFESVPDLFLDEIPDEWAWHAPDPADLVPRDDAADTRHLMPVPQKRDEFAVPVLLSRDFLAMYNLGFANSRGLPVLPEDGLRLIPLNLRISNPSGSVELKARIVGLTSKISSILIPQSCMEWANANYGRDTLSGHPRRLILRVDDPSLPALEEFLRAHNYEVSDSSKGLRETSYIIDTVLSIVALIGGIMLALSLLVFFLNLQLFLSNSRSDMELLMLLGYPSGLLSVLSTISAAIPLLLVCASAFVATLSINTAFVEFMAQKSISFAADPPGQFVFIALGGPLVLIVIQWVWLSARFKTLSIGKG